MQRRQLKGRLAELFYYQSTAARELNLTEKQLSDVVSGRQKFLKREHFESFKRIFGDETEDLLSGITVTED